MIHVVFDLAATMFAQRWKHLVFLSLKRLEPSGGIRGPEDERQLIFIFACLGHSLKAAQPSRWSAVVQCGSCHGRRGWPEWQASAAVKGVPDSRDSKNVIVHLWTPGSRRCHE